MSTNISTFSLLLKTYHEAVNNSHAIYISINDTLKPLNLPVKAGATRNPLVTVA